MEHFPRPLTKEESDELIERIEAGFGQCGFGLWAVEVRSSGELAGFTGLAVPPFEAHFMPAVEVGWRLARPAWGHGYATEAARAALEFGFGEAGLGEVVSLTTAGNRRSRAVMERLGMTRDPGDDFEHPALAEGDPLRRHVLYRLRKGDLPTR
jgi:ribosomal-protein-alanine N-acetyltransferase